MSTRGRAHSEPPDDDSARGAGRRTIPREQDAPRPLIVAMILAILAIMTAVYLAAERTGISEHVLGRPSPLAGEGPIFSVAEIEAEAAPASLLGRDVAIWGARVVRVSGDWLFWIGSDPTRAVPTVLLGEQTARQAESQTEIRAGDVIAVFGTMHGVRDIALLEPSHALSPVDRTRLMSARVYISALRVEHVAPLRDN